MTEKAWVPVTRDTLEKAGVEVVHHFGADAVAALGLYGFPLHAANYPGGLYAKEVRISEGVSLAQHTHPHAHLSVLAAGSALVGCDGDSMRLTALSVIEIAAGKPHQVEALTPVVWFCIHETPDTDPETVDTSILSA